VWDYIRSLNPDVAFLQEVCSVPGWITESFAVLSKRAVRKTGADQIFSNVIMVRGTIGPAVQLTSTLPWVRNELSLFSNNVFAVQIEPHCSSPFVGVCVYSPAWPVDRKRLSAADISDVRLTQNNDVWVTDLLREALLNADLSAGAPWVVAGDFNMCETFDAWRGGPRGNREFLDRLLALGLTDCLRFSRGALTPTFKTLRTGLIKSQIDYIFATDALLERLISCDTGPEEIIPSGVSDHLPVVADFAPL
jgi:endonuclease/exonuclease/phosphatase family metal-dependent hydrolase